MRRVWWRPGRDRGVDAPAATLTAKAGVAVFEVAFEQWVDETNRRPLQELIRGTLEEFRAVAAAR